MVTVGLINAHWKLNMRGELQYVSNKHFGISLVFALVMSFLQPFLYHIVNRKYLFTFKKNLSMEKQQFREV